MIQFASTPKPVPADEQGPAAAPAPSPDADSASPASPPAEAPVPPSAAAPAPLVDADPTLPADSDAAPAPPDSLAAPDPDRTPSQQERLAAMDALSRLGDEIAEMSAHLDAATFRMLERLREFDDKEGWTGFRSCAAWLSWRTSLAPGAAREHVRVARALGDLPLLSEEMKRGRVSYSKARALTRIATRANETQLVELARSATAAQTEQFVRGWRQVDRAKEAEDERARHRSRKLALYADADGSWVVRGRLDPEVGAMLQKALEAADRIVYPKGSPQADRPTWDQRRADAMGLVAEAALGEGLALPNDTPKDTPSDPSPESSQGEFGPSEFRSGKARRAERFQVVLHVTPEDLRATPDVSAETSAGGMAEVAAKGPGSDPASPGPKASGDGEAAAGAAAGTPCGCGGIGAGRHASAALPGRLLSDRGRVSAETSRRIACDASLVRMTLAAHEGDSSMGRSKVLDVGRKSRTVPPALRRALEVRDGGCRFPGCSVGVRWCDAHHVAHWTDGGETKLDNLLLACSLHHRALHEEGYRVELDPDGVARFLRPDGALIPEVPPPPVVRGDPVAKIREDNRERGIDIDGWTPTPSWLGEPFDPHWAVGVMWTPAEEKEQELAERRKRKKPETPTEEPEGSTGRKSERAEKMDETGDT